MTEDTLNTTHDQRPNIILIIGLSHGGSTILERALASHPQAIGLGEVYHTIRPYFREGWSRIQRSCSCGLPGWECFIWSRLSFQPEQASFQERLADLIKHAASTTGARVLIDSSKRRDQARLYAPLQNQGYVNIYPLILVRDYRAWATTSAHKRRGWTSDWDYISLAWKWLFRHLLMRVKLRWLGFRAPIILFDHFTQSPEHIVEKIYAPLQAKGINPPPQPLDLDHSRQHALTGNGIRTDSSRNRSIISDDSWQKDPRVTRMRWFTWGPEMLRRWLWKQ